MDDSTAINLESRLKPTTVFLGPLLDNVLKTGAKDTKASLSIHGVFFENLLLSDSVLLNHPTFYELYKSKNTRHFIEDWLQIGYFAPCLRDTVKSFTDLVEIQDKANMPGRITEVVGNKQGALEYAKFLDHYSHRNQKFNLKEISNRFKQALKIKMADQVLLKDYNLDDISQLIKDYIEFLTDHYGGITRSNLYHLAEPDQYKDDDLVNDVEPFLKHQNIKKELLQQKINLRQDQLKSLVDTIYNGNIPNVLQTAVAVPRNGYKMFKRVWNQNIKSEGFFTGSNLRSVQLDSTLLLSKTGLAKLEARDLEYLRSSPEWQNHIMSINTNKDVYKTLREYSQAASEYVTECIIARDSSMRMIRTTGNLLSKLREITDQRQLECIFSVAAEAFRWEIELPPEVMEYTILCSEHLVKEQELNKKITISDLIKADIQQLGVCEISCM